MLRKLESVVETVQEEMFDDGKPLQEIKTWMNAQKKHFDEIKNVKTGLNKKKTEKKQKHKLEEINREMKRQKIINEEDMQRIIK